MKIRIANPFYYPLAILIGGIILVLGTRLIKVSNFIIIPTAATATVVVATFLQPQKTILKDLGVVKEAARNLAQKASLLKQEADKILINNSSQLELLGVVQLACERAIELPLQIDRLIQKMGETKSLLSPEDLRQQLIKVRAKIKSSSGIARENLQRLENSLNNNIQLAQMGQDIRQAQIINLQTLIQDSAGVLQKLQNKLVSADLSRSSEIQELKNLGDELNSYQENVEVIIH
jgi:hypothetical protein